MSKAKQARELLRMTNIRADEMQDRTDGDAKPILEVANIVHCIYFTIAFGRIVLELEADETN